MAEFKPHIELWKERYTSFCWVWCGKLQSTDMWNLDPEQAYGEEGEGTHWDICKRLKKNINMVAMTGWLKLYPFLKCVTPANHIKEQGFDQVECLMCHVLSWMFYLSGTSPFKPSKVPECKKERAECFSPVHLGIINKKPMNHTFFASLL